MQFPGPSDSRTGSSTSADRVQQGSSSLPQALSAEDLQILAHEIRTPLSCIIAAVELAQHTSGAQSQEASIAQGGATNYMAMIADSSEHLLRLVNNLLDYARLQAGKMIPVPQSINVPEVIESKLRTFAAEASLKGLQLSADCDASVPQQLMLDPLSLSQALFNLIGNAIKNTPQGGAVKIEARLITNDGAHTGLQISVRDSGRGMNADQISQLFQPFHQSHQDDENRSRGSGLGLAISQALIQAMGGELRVHSEPGHGSTFSFMIPVALDQTGEASSSRSSPSSTTRSGDSNSASRSAQAERLQGKTVLLVDDNPMSLSLHARLLTRAGLKVVEARDGFSALQKLQQGPIDVVLTDLDMPGIAGIELARQIHSQPEHRQMPILAFSAMATPADLQACAAAGLRGHIAKPCSTQDLLAKMCEHLSLNPR